MTGYFIETCGNGKFCVKITLRELAKVYDESALKANEKFICYILADLCVTGDIQYNDFYISGITEQFMDQWFEKVLKRRNIFSHDFFGYSFLTAWNSGTEYSHEEFMKLNVASISGYRQWVLDKASEKYGDEEFIIHVSLI